MDTRVKPAYDNWSCRNMELRSTTPVIDANASRRIRVMTAASAVFAVAALALISTVPADAKGCLKGAAVGGVAGHYAGHHGVLGAIAGCAYGRHRANEQDRQQGRQGQPPAGQEKL
jgi:outer membrane lipoprotein SlyB